MCWFLLGWRSGAYHFVSLLLWHWLSCLEHVSYITANIPGMCLMLDQFLWGHSLRDCDISCFYSNHIVRLSVRPASCPEHISYILWGTNSKFDVWMHLGMVECRVPFSGHSDLDLVLWPSFKIIVSRAYLILFEVGISNLVCECILGWQSVPYHNWVTVTLNLTSDLVSRKCIESCAYSYILWDRNSKFGV